MPISTTTAAELQDACKRKCSKLFTQGIRQAANYVGGHKAAPEVERPITLSTTQSWAWGGGALGRLFNRPGIDEYGRPPGPSPWVTEKKTKPGGNSRRGFYFFYPSGHEQARYPLLCFKASGPNEQFSYEGKLRARTLRSNWHCVFVLRKPDLSGRGSNKVPLLNNRGRNPLAWPGIKLY